MQRRVQPIDMQGCLIVGHPFWLQCLSIVEQCWRVPIICER